MSRRVVWGAALALGAACGDRFPNLEPGPPVETEQLAAQRVTGGIRLTNKTTARLAYVMVDPQWLGRIAICIDLGEGCLRLVPGTTLAPLSETLGVTSATKEVEVLWWEVLPDGSGGLRATTPKSLTVSIR